LKIARKILNRKGGDRKTGQSGTKQKEAGYAGILTQNKAEARVTGLRKANGSSGGCPGCLRKNFTFQILGEN